MLRNQQIKSGSEGTPAGHEGFDVESAEASFPKEESKLNNAISIGNTRLPIVDAIRVLCSFIIICAHLDMLFRKESNTHRRLEEDDDGQTLKVALKCITGTVVQGFFNLSGFVVAYQFLTNRVDSLRASLLSRPFRMLIPLALVQIVDLGLYLSDLAYFNYQSKPSWETVQDDFSSLRFVFASSLNGPLWVIEAFFFLP